MDHRCCLPAPGWAHKRHGNLASRGVSSGYYQPEPEPYEPERGVNNQQPARLLGLLACCVAGCGERDTPPGSGNRDHQPLLPLPLPLPMPPPVAHGVAAGAGVAAVAAEALEVRLITHHLAPNPVIPLPLVCPGMLSPWKA